MSDDKPILLPLRSKFSGPFVTILFYLILAAGVATSVLLAQIVRDLWRASALWAGFFWIVFLVIMIGILRRVRKNSLARWDPANVETQGLVMPPWARRMLPVCEISVAAGAGVLPTISFANPEGLLLLYSVAALAVVVMGGLGWFIKWWAELDGWKSKDPG